MPKPGDVADMVEEELRAERERVKDVPTVPPKTVLERVAGLEVQEADDPAPARPIRKARLVEQVAVTKDPRREDTEPPAPASAPADPSATPTKPPPPGYDGSQTG